MGNNPHPCSNSKCGNVIWDGELIDCLNCGRFFCSSCFNDRKVCVYCSGKEIDKEDFFHVLEKIHPHILETLKLEYQAYYKEMRWNDFLSQRKISEGSVHRFEFVDWKDDVSWKNITEAQNKQIMFLYELGQKPSFQNLHLKIREEDIPYESDDSEDLFKYISKQLSLHQPQIKSLLLDFESGEWCDISKSSLQDIESQLTKLDHLEVIGWFEGSLLYSSYKKEVAPRELHSDSLKKLTLYLQHSPIDGELAELLDRLYPFNSSSTKLIKEHLQMPLLETLIVSYELSCLNFDCFQEEYASRFCLPTGWRNIPLKKVYWSEYNGINLIVRLEFDFSSKINTDIDIEVPFGNSKGLIGLNYYSTNFSERNLDFAKQYKAFLTNPNLEGAILRNVNLTGADLTGANLIGTDLTGADLTGADLTGADLTKSTLKNTNFNSAHLYIANLTDANLAGAILTNSNLIGVNLTGADLTGADLTGANLTGADLTGAKLTGADLTDANLKGVNLKGIRSK